MGQKDDRISIISLENIVLNYRKTLKLGNLIRRGDWKIPWISSKRLIVNNEFKENRINISQTIELPLSTSSSKTNWKFIKSRILKMELFKTEQS